MYSINQQNTRFLNKYFNVLIFNFLMSCTYSEPEGGHLQEDGCIYMYGTVHFTCISIRNLVGRREKEKVHFLVYIV